MTLATTALRPSVLMGSASLRCWRCGSRERQLWLDYRVVLPNGRQIPIALCGLCGLAAEQGAR